jgi:hypothetical protein
MAALHLIAGGGASSLNWAEMRPNEFGPTNPDALERAIDLDYFAAKQ